MGVSETIVAAMIGAMATMLTAMFQLFGAIRAKSKVDAKPRRGMTMRSVLAILAVMVASAAGGFLYSELLKERHREDMRAMRLELKELKELAAAAAREKQALPMMVPAADPALMSPMRSASITEDAVESSISESVVYVPACRAQVTGARCEEVDAQRIALCGTIPSFAQVRGIELFAQPDAMQNPWDEHRVLFEQDLGGARFTGKSFEYAQGETSKAVCVNFFHWSSEHPHIARLTVQYGFGPATSEPVIDSSFGELEATVMR